MNIPKNYDFIIAGAGIIGLAIGHTIKKRKPDASILILEKEEDVACHASGRNSGVLHAGFYYTADSLKARFTVEGNKRLRQYCQDNGLKVNACGKLVVAQNPQEVEALRELDRRGKRNRVDVTLISEKEAKSIEPNIRTYQLALYSPTTASIDPTALCQSLKQHLANKGVEFRFHCPYQGHNNNTIYTPGGKFYAKKFLNCAGLYADKIAQDFGFGHRYTLIPFKGLYLKYTKNTTDIRINIYPVPNLKNPFLGVHFTKTVDNEIKIGPTATPAFWRENYRGVRNFRWGEFLATTGYLGRLFLTNAFGFRSLAIEEMKKYSRRYCIEKAALMVEQIDPNGFGGYTPPGIRAQLLDKQTLSLVQDFVVEGDKRSVHILNAVSPALTCALPFSEFIVEKYLRLD